MKQPFHHSDDPAEVLVQKLEEQQAKEEIFHTDPRTKNRPSGIFLF